MQERSGALAIYDGVLANIYDEYTAADDRNDLIYWEKLLTLHAGKALELGCGTGRLLIPLLKAGLDVEGLDHSGDMLSRCRDKAQAEGLSVVLHPADMTSYSLDTRYRTIFSAAGSFTLLSAPGQMEAAFATARAHLEPGGTLALSMDPPPIVSSSEPVTARDIIRASDGARLRCVLSPLPSEQPDVVRWRMTNSVIKEGASIASDTTEIAFRRPKPEDFVQMLNAAGFAAVDLVSLDDRETSPEGAEYVALARAA